MNKSNREKYCLITGASRGLGRELAHHFWRHGWNLFLVAKQQANLDELTSSFETIDGQCFYGIAADLEYFEEIERVVKMAQSFFPSLDVLINNAAIQGPIGALWKNERADWLQTIAVDLLAPIDLCRLLAPWMIKSGKGSIINIAGGGATGPRENFSAYATAKTGLVRFSETLSKELAPYDIKVNCVSPGAMKTDMIKEIFVKEEDYAGKKEQEAALKILSSEDSSINKAVELCAFLASDKSKGLTGKLISAVWDQWEDWPKHIDELSSSDAYTLRRITGRDRGFTWSDK